ncbi:MAG: NADH:flavin oxidoreductase [Bacteroidetes bacterium]|nr:MAG: NADH:flavin oxidoreductase [Bacteroidota bacterium]
MSVLFQQTNIKGMELKNRLVRSATVEGMADPEGAPTQDLFRLYKRLAKGDVGLIITGAAYVSKDSKLPFYGMAAIRDNNIKRYRDLVEHVHANGARIAMQIVHAGRQTTREAAGTQPIAPSAVEEKVLFVKPRAMTEDDIERVIEDFSVSARRVKEAGFDAVQIHAAHGYLVNQFLCPHTNRRSDSWGGTLENRMRFVRAIYERCRKEVGKDFPILIKINGNDNMKNGLKTEESALMAEMMSDMGFDGIEVSCGIGEDGLSQLRGEVPMEAMLKEWPMYRNKNYLFRLFMKHFGRKMMNTPPLVEAYNRDAARLIKSKVKVPVFLVGGVTDPAAMEDIVKNGDADYISLCRSLIADPGFVELIRSGSKERSRCIHCNLCLAYMVSYSLKCYNGKMIDNG